MPGESYRHRHGRETPSRRKRLALRLCVSAALIGAASGWVGSSWTAPVRWSPDGLFYQQSLLRFHGLSATEAHEQVFAGPVSATLRKPGTLVATQLADPRWVKYVTPFYERRPAIPLAGAAIYPLAKNRALLYVSLTGYLAVIVALYFFLLLDFSVPVAGAVAAATIPLPSLVGSSTLPLTDSWGLALEIAALALAITASRRGLRWIWPWVGIIALLSFTRDDVWIPLLASAWCAIRIRTRVWVITALTGFAAVLPSLLATDVPFRQDLAFTVNNFQVPPSTSLGFIARHYPGAVSDLVRSDLGAIRRGEWYIGLYMIGGFMLFFLLSRGWRLASRTLLTGVALAGIVYLLALPNYTGFRLELVFVPICAAGAALAVERGSRAVYWGRATSPIMRNPFGKR